MSFGGGKLIKQVDLKSDTKVTQHKAVHVCISTIKNLHYIYFNFKNKFDLKKNQSKYISLFVNKTNCAPFSDKFQKTTDVTLYFNFRALKMKSREREF